MLLIDKSTIQSLNIEEIVYLDKYYSLVVSPILMRELLSTLAKEDTAKYDWKKILSILAAKTDTFNSYTPVQAHQLAIGSLMGHDVPMTGQIPLGGGNKVRTRDGSYAAIYGESPEKKILRDWKNSDFSQKMFDDAKKIRSLDTSVDLAALQKDLDKKLTYIPKFKTLDELVKWFDDDFVKGMNPEFLFSLIATSVTTRPDEMAHAIKDWMKAGKPNIQQYCSYAFYYYRVNMIYFTGLARGLISPGKGAKTHLDIQYIYYLPFCHCFASNDKFLLNIAKYFKRENQIIINGNVLKEDLKNIKQFFEENSDKKGTDEFSFGSYPPDIPGSLTFDIWKKIFGPKQKRKTKPESSSPERSKEVSRMIRTMDDAIDVETNQTLKPRKSEFVSMSLIDRQIYFTNKVNELLKLHERDEWDEVRKNISENDVYEIYDLHASIWHPDDNYKQLVAQFLDETKERRKFLYLGDIYEEDISQDIYRWAIYFDLILIPDPFQTPWSKKREYNPLSDAKIYLSDTLKLVYFLTLLSPLIAAGKAVIVPDIPDFNPKLKEKFFKIAEERGLTTDEEKVISSPKISKRHLDNFLRQIASQPESNWQKYAKGFFEQMGLPPPPISMIREKRKNDPICIDRDIELRDLIIHRSGATLEEALYLCAIYEAIPFSSMKVRTLQFQKMRESEVFEKLGISKFFEDIPTLKFVDPLMIESISKYGLFNQLEVFLEVLTEGKELETLKSETSPTKDDTIQSIESVAELHGEFHGIDWKDLIISKKWDIAFNPTGLRTSDTKRLLDEIDPVLFSKLPKLYIGLPEGD